MDRSITPITFLAVFPFFFVGMWCFVCLLLSRLGGWHRLAERFPARGEPSGVRFGMQSGKVGWVNYGNCLTVHAAPDGIYLSIWMPWRLGHPPLFVPWQAMHNVQPRRSLWAERVSVDVGAPTITSVQLSKKVFDAGPIAA